MKRNSNDRGGLVYSTSQGQMCPKCRQPGVLYAQRSIHALIGSRHIAHVLHASTADRRMGLLTRWEVERILQPLDAIQAVLHER